MIPRRYLRYGSIVILVYFVIVILVGCSHKIQPKAWMSVEKAPMRVIIVDNEKDIDSATIHMVIDHLRSVPYKDYQFNSETGIGINHNVDYSRQDHTSSSIAVGDK